MSAVASIALPHAPRPAGVRRLAILLPTMLMALGIFSTPASAAPPRLAAAHSLTTASARAQIVKEAARHLGARYSWGAAGPSRFDCSGFTSFVYGRFGLALPHQSGAQLGFVRRIPIGSKLPGDLIFFRTSSGRIDHVGIYAGGNSVYAASKAAGRVKLQGIYSSRISVGRVG